MNKFQGYLDNLVSTDHGLNGDRLLGWLTLRMQHRYPGNYYISRHVNADGYTYYIMTFNTPEEETLFNLRWG